MKRISNITSWLFFLAFASVASMQMLEYEFTITHPVWTILVQLSFLFGMFLCAIFNKYDNEK